MSEETENSVEENGKKEDAIIICDVANPDPDDSGSIQVSATKEGKTGSIYYNFGADLTSMIERFGEEVVFGYARGQMVIRLQASMRSRLISGGDVPALASEFKPGIAMAKTPKDMKKATENYFMSLSQEEQDTMVKKLMEKMGIQS